MSELVSYKADGDVAVISIENPPVNALSPGVPEGIAAGIKQATQDQAVTSVVLIGSGRTFIAGADIKEFGKITSGARKPDFGLLPILLEIENCPKPVVAAIHGTALGGGLETAMACHYRVAVADAQVGQPEVKLGIIPGAAGTQRLPRLVGVAKAAELCAIGAPISAADAEQIGLVDAIVEGELLAGASAFARERAASGDAPRKTREISDRFGDREEYQSAAKTIGRKASKVYRGMQAPLKAIEAVQAAATTSFEEGCALEGKLFQECLFSAESKGMIQTFFGERIVSKIPGIAKDTPRIEIKTAAVVGAGTMGGGIAMNYVNAGIPVTLKEVSQEALDRGLSIIRGNYEKTMQKGRLTQEQLDQRMSLIQPTLNYEDLGQADIIVEAVFENMDLKKQVFAELDKVAGEGSILASNTSTLDVDEIASVTSRPEMVIGHHFFSPANVMKLLEIVRGEKTSDAVIATSMALAKRLRKTGVLVGNCWGFVGNRMFGPYMREAEFLAEDGASPRQIDTVLYKFGMAMGPLAVGDLAGLDVGWKVREEIKESIPEGMRPHRIGDALYELGRYGQKTGKGWYRYESGSRAPVPDPEVATLIEKCAQAGGIERRDIGDEEIVERTLYALVNEGAKILEEGFALRAVDIDIVYVYGYGFPAFRGGPMLYGSTVGLDKVCARVREFEKEHGFWWKPAPLLERLADEGKTFADYDSERGRA